MKGFYFITDASLSRAGIMRDVKSALAAGVQAVQYRNKCARSKQMLAEAFAIGKLCKGKALCIINDRVDIACAVGADGVHLGQDDMPYCLARKMLGKGKMIGVTVHTLAQAVEAAHAGADYLGVAPIFATRTKIDTGKACGVGLIRQIKKRVSIPLVAIGGINLSNMQQVVDAGAQGVCALSAVVKKNKVKEEIEKFQRFF
jgi:thiamine-phosphate pyrophosphorylase